MKSTERVINGGMEFFHFLDVAITNSFILFKIKSQGKLMSLKEFILALVAGLVGIPHTSPRGKLPQKKQ